MMSDVRITSLLQYSLSPNFFISWKFCVRMYLVANTSKIFIALSSCPLSLLLDCVAPIYDK